MRNFFMRYAVVIEDAGTNFSAYVPDLPGCVATGSTVAETEQAIREAIALHLEGLPGRRLADHASVEQRLHCSSLSPRAVA
jgi:predicted RNase H-like HicB family nuclease